MKFCHDNLNRTYSRPSFPWQDFLGREFFIQPRSSEEHSPDLRCANVASPTLAGAFLSVSRSFAEGYPTRGLSTNLTHELPTDGDAGPQTTFDLDRFSTQGLGTGLGLGHTTGHKGM